VLRLRGPDWRGGKQRIVKLVSALGLEHWIEVGPAIYGREKWTLLSGATGFVYPSRWEGFGNSLAEAVAMGVPALATPYPLAASLAERGGVILSEPNPRSLAQGLCAASDVGRRGAQIINEQFTWMAVARRWIAQATALLEEGK
jgi:glycosyltransferase involved in cell wall biosynthesis